MSLPPYSYRVVWSEEDGEYVAASDEFPNLSGMAKTQEQAAEELAIAVSLAVEYLRERGEPLPIPRARFVSHGEFQALGITRSTTQSTSADPAPFPSLLSGSFVEGEDNRWTSA